MMRKRIVRVGGVLLAALLGALIAGFLGPLSCGHNPNHGIDREKARAAAQRVHASPPPGVRMEPGHGG